MPHDSEKETAQIAETLDQDEELALTIEQQMALVEPILTGLFESAATGKDYWLKKRNLVILADWLQQVITHNSILNAKAEALEAALAQAAEAANESRIWVPH